VALKDQNGNPTSAQAYLFTPLDWAKELYGKSDYWVAKAGKYELQNGTVTAPDNVISFRRLIRTISVDGIMKALHKTVREVAQEAGIRVDNLRNADKEIVYDGVNIYLIPILTYQTNNGDRVTAVFHIEGLTLKANSVDELLDIGDVAVAPVAEISSEEVCYTSDISDRRGVYRFEVPFTFGVMNSELSYLRLKAERFDYFPSGYVNVPAFEHEDYQRTVRYVNIPMEPKDVYSLTVDLKVNGSDDPQDLAERK
jgi:hypothetical protein